jgi:acetyl esterase
MTELTPETVRRHEAEIVNLNGSGPPLARVDDFAIPTDENLIRARKYAPAAPLGIILWLHGGGWVIGGLETHDAMCRLLALSSGMSVVAIDYRVAPEDPFPAPLDDCWAALRWVGQWADGPLVLGGDSAGGNLAAVCAARARDAAGPAVAAQVLVYPVCDHDFTRASYNANRAEGLLSRSEMEWFWDQYVADPVTRDHPAASPLLIDDLSALPSTIIVQAEHDPLLDEGRAYAARLRQAGVAVEEHFYAGMAHSFFPLVNLMPTGAAAVRRVGKTLSALTTV